jgi:glycosyltransferase involved in cell wall biosynthesis
MISEHTWIVIPAYNEAEVIGDVVADGLRFCRNVVVTDDCSTDCTGAIAHAAGAVVLRHAVNLGQGAALQTSIDHALAHGAQAIITFDADGQHRASDIEILQRTQSESGADLVLGSRFLGSSIGMPATRLLALKAAVAFSRINSGTRLTDAHNGLRLLTGSAARQIRIRQNRMAHASEIVQQARELGLRIAEAPVTIAYTERSLRKGQRIGNAVSILADLFVAKLRR